MEADAIVVGGGLAGLVAATEIAGTGRRVFLLEQEPYLGGQAYWSFGGLFLVDSPEQRRLGIRDSLELAREDWFGAAGFDRETDSWGRRFAEAYLEFAAGEKRAWLTSLGVRFFPVVGWAERGGGLALGHGNSVPRFHIVWGTGPGLLEPFLRRVQELQDRGLLKVFLRHRVEEVLLEKGRVVGVMGTVLEPDTVPRGGALEPQAQGGVSLPSPGGGFDHGGYGGQPGLGAPLLAQAHGGTPKEDAFRGPGPRGWIGSFPGGAGWGCPC